MPWWRAFPGRPVGREGCLLSVSHVSAGVGASQGGHYPLVSGGIVTNGGVASTVRDAHVRGFDVTVLSDGCAAFERRVHEVNLEALGGIAQLSTCAALIDQIWARVYPGAASGSKVSRLKYGPGWPGYGR
ncbi:MAG: hypothetical protein CM1200mP20_08800 [Pseudomonadota bacterium]|nr:MAG: hypothetical protein CM1200mP20_08800 [Pseudomonadota bacterium]